MFFYFEWRSFVRVENRILRVQNKVLVNFFWKIIILSSFSEYRLETFRIFGKTFLAGCSELSFTCPKEHFEENMDFWKINHSLVLSEFEFLQSCQTALNVSGGTFLGKNYLLGKVVFCYHFHTLGEIFLVLLQKNCRVVKLAFFIFSGASWRKKV